MITIQLITDSLGLSREEIPIKDVWTTRIIKQYTQNDDIVLLRGKYGMSMNDIYEEREQILSCNKPDIIILQIGIVDACRRAMPPFLSSIIKQYPNTHLGKKIIRFAGKYHYEITNKFNWHTCSIQDFEIKCREVVRLAKKSNKHCKIALIKIIEPKFKQLKKCAFVKEDVNKYNRVLEKVAKAEGCRIIDPLKEKQVGQYVLIDGHHLNKIGNIQLYQHVVSFLDEMLIGRD